MRTPSRHLASPPVLHILIKSTIWTRHAMNGPVPSCIQRRISRPYCSYTSNTKLLGWHPPSRHFSSFAFPCSHRDYLSHSCLDRYEASFIKCSFLYKIVFLSLGRQETCSAFELHAQICLISGPSLEPGNFVVIARYLSSLQLICEVYKKAAAPDCSPRI